MDTTRRSALVISLDGFILWEQAGEPAFMSGLFIRSNNVTPVEVPSVSLLGRADLADVGREGVDHPPGVWFSEHCHEITIHSDKYDQSLAILHFDRDTRTFRSFGGPTSQMRSTGSTKSRVTGLAERARTPHLTSRKERAPTLHCMFDHGFSPPRVR